MTGSSQDAESGGEDAGSDTSCISRYVKSFVTREISVPERMLGEGIGNKEVLESKFRSAFILSLFHEQLELREPPNIRLTRVYPCLLFDAAIIDPNN